MSKISNLYLRAASGEHTPVKPVWLMRQAGRYLPEYRAMRKEYSFLEICNNPELTKEVTLMPINRYHFDAAIMFSDILIPLVPMGADLSFVGGVGPKISNVLRTREDVETISDINPVNDLAEVLEAIRITRKELSDDIALIGFAGAPFTLACYWIEGEKPQPFANVKRMMYNDPELFHQLLMRLARTVTDTLTAMVDAGVDAIQVFDTWAGIMPEHEFRRHNLPVLQSIFSELKNLNAPSTIFVRDSNHILNEIKKVGADIVGLDWRTRLDTARLILGTETTIQGNLDPTVLFGDEQTIRQEVQRIQKEAGDDGGHIFNLGHGILPATPVESVEVMLDEIRGSSREQ